MSNLRDISLTQLVYFVRCAESASMTQAAASLLVAQSAVSASIANLERSLGTPLFVRRHSRGLALTTAGETFLRRTRRVLADLDDAMADVDPGLASGTLRVGVFPTLAPFHIPEIAHRLARSHPGIEPEFVELSAGEIDAALGDHAIEVALTYDLGLRPTTVRERLRVTSVYAAFASDHPLACRERVSIAELVDEPMVLLDLPHSRDFFIDVFAHHGLVPRVRHRFASFETVRSMVSRGHGFTLLSQRPGHDLTYAGERLAVVELREEVDGLDIVLAAAQPLHAVGRRAQAFAAQCRAVLAGAPVPTDDGGVPAA